MKNNNNNNKKWREESKKGKIRKSREKKTNIPFNFYIVYLDA